MRITSKLLMLAAFVALAPSLAQAWTCADAASGGGWKQVPTGTVGNGVGDGNLQVQVIDGITFQCQPAAPPTGDPITNTNTSNSNSSSNSKSSSNSSSNSTGIGVGVGIGGNSSATGGAGGAGGTGGTSTSTSTATGGAGGAGGSVTGSGNSANTNTNVAEGGQGGSVKNSGNSSINNSGNSKIENSGNSNQKQYQGQSQSQKTTVSGNGVGDGDNANNSTNITNVPRDVATAYSPSVYPTVQCFKGIGVGAQGTVFGASFGGGRIDENCAALEAARQAPSLIARCKILLQNKYYKQAGVTMDDCLEQPAPRVIVQAPTASPAPTIVVNVPPIVVPTPQISVAVEGQAPAAKPLPPPVKQHHVRKPCPANKTSVGVFTDDSFTSPQEPINAVCE